MVDGITQMSEPRECTIPRMNHNGNSGLWVTMTCQLGFINCNKFPSLGIDIESGRTGIGAGGYIETLCNLYVILLWPFHKPLVSTT